MKTTQQHKDEKYELSDEDLEQVVAGGSDFNITSENDGDLSGETIFGKSVKVNEVLTVVPLSKTGETKFE